MHSVPASACGQSRRTCAHTTTSSQRPATRSTTVAAATCEHTCAAPQTGAEHGSLALRRRQPPSRHPAAKGTPAHTTRTCTAARMAYLSGSFSASPAAALKSWLSTRAGRLSTHSTPLAWGVMLSRNGESLAACRRPRARVRSCRQRPLAAAAAAVSARAGWGVRACTRLVLLGAPALRACAAPATNQHGVLCQRAEAACQPHCRERGHGQAGIATAQVAHACVKVVGAWWCAAQGRRCRRCGARPQLWTPSGPGGSRCGTGRVHLATHGPHTDGAQCMPHDCVRCCHVQQPAAEAGAPRAHTGTTHPGRCPASPWVATAGACTAAGRGRATACPLQH
jgi:hypothetical protein